MVSIYRGKEKKLRKWFETQELKSPKNLGEAARLLIDLVTQRKWQSDAVMLFSGGVIALGIVLVIALASI